VQVLVAPGSTREAEARRRCARDSHVRQVAGNIVGSCEVTRTAPAFARITRAYELVRLAGGGVVRDGTKASVVEAVSIVVGRARVAEPVVVYGLLWGCPLSCLLAACLCGQVACVAVVRGCGGTVSPKAVLGSKLGQRSHWL